MKKESEQTALDLRFDYERDLRHNIIEVVKFTQHQMESDMDLKTIGSRQEAYGVAAQAFYNETQKFKAMKKALDVFLERLDDSVKAGALAGDIYDAAIDLAEESAVLAAKTKRIFEDLRR